MMKFISPRARFNGTLNGIKVEDLKGLDYNVETIEGRLKEVRDKLDKIMPFFDEYFYTSEEEDENGEKPRQYYKFDPNTTDELSEDINVCKYIQSYGSYILNSKDLPREKQMDYTILTEDDFKKQLLKEMATDFKSDATVVLDTRPTNDYKNLDLKITKKDMYPELQKNPYGVRDKDIELASILNDYETLREHLRSEMAKIKDGEGSYLSLYKIKSMLSTIIGDMYDAKRMVLGIRNQAKRLGDESPYNDFSTLDYTNQEHIKHMLKFCSITKTPRPDDMVSHIGYDLYRAINKLSKRKKIDNVDREIIECYNSGNYSLEDIGKELNISKVAVFKRINKISKKISEVI